VIESIRAIFRNDARNRTSLDVNEMIGEALALLRADRGNEQAYRRGDALEKRR